MKDLIKIAEEQMETLRNMQTSAFDEDEIVVRVSSEIRMWCCFIKEFKEFEIQKKIFIKQQEQMCKIGGTNL